MGRALLGGALVLVGLVLIPPFLITAFLIAPLLITVFLKAVFWVAAPLGTGFGFVVQVAALAQGFLLAALLQFHVLQLFFGFKGPAGGGLDAALLLHARLTGGQLVFHGHHAGTKTLPFLLFPARATDAKFLQQTGAELLELLFSTFVNNDPIGPTAHDFFNGELPGAQHPFPKERHPHGPDHQGGEFTSFDVEAEPQDPTELLSRLGDHLAIDHLGVALGVEPFA